ncbi:hypothetical protein GOP47_0010497 [Adiantum capillus-veneris]|uniref:Strictosidine synthase conserved region domain-containing protein n=1 Tax=Adiantum capillus-veneris TaxID=13818 RepID=A0A9D4UV86_ADICA|nr:hypothetical protein GOP47_0010497 [Adiantum capillus-veneris]
MELWFVLVVAVAIAIAASYKAVDRYSTIRPLPLLLSPPVPLIGPFAPNSLLLTHLHRIGDGLLPSPEDVVVDAQGFLFVGCSDGWIKRIHPKSDFVEDWVFLGAGHSPLGLVLGRHGELIVCDPDVGLLNVTKDKVEVLSQEAEGVKFMLTDAAAVSMEDGSIYFTDATDKYPFAHHINDLMEARPNGRLLKYDEVTRITTVLMDHLYFANGVVLSSNEDFLVVCETVMARCQRYWLKGEKKGRFEIFIDRLPAYPDNIKSDGKGQFWIALVGARPFYMDWAMRSPFLKQLQQVLGLTDVFLKRLNKRALVLTVTEDGEPLRTLADPTGDAIKSVTTAYVVGDNLYLGNLGENFLGHVKLNKTI